MRAVRIASWVLVFVAIGSAAAAWFTPRDIEPDDAQRVALGAMEAAGVEDAEVNEPIVEGIHFRSSGDDDGDGDDGEIVASEGDAAESGQPAAGSTSRGDETGDASEETAARETKGSTVPETKDSTAPKKSSSSLETTSTTQSGEPTEAWIVFVEADDATIEFRVDQGAGELLYVDDLVGQDKQDRFFSNEQWETVRHYRDGKLSSWVGRNTMGSMAAVLIVGAGFVLAKRSDLVGGESD